MKPFVGSIKFVHVSQQFGAIIGNCFLEGCESKFKDFPFNDNDDNGVNAQN
jgi:hypothetical protein